MTSSAEHADWRAPKRPRKTLAELLAEVDSKPMSVADFETPGAFEDGELEEFLAWLRESRRSDCV